MAARVWCCVLWIVVALFLFMPVHGAEASGEVLEPECENRKRASMRDRAATTTIDFIDALPKEWDNKKAVTVNFMHVEFGELDSANIEGGPLTYGCEAAELDGTFPSYGGFAWALLMPNQTGFSLIEPGRIDTSIRSYLEERASGVYGLGDVDTFRVLVSGPFWKLSRRGEIPIGALIEDGVAKQDFRTNFSAKYVLCSKKGGGVELMGGKVGGKVEAVENLDDLSCAAAIQVGPALLERSRAHEHSELRTQGRAKLGIGVNSRNRSRRNILIGVKADAPTRGASEHLVLFSTLFDIASYDAMVASEVLTRKLSDEGTLVGKVSIAWAVGLVDDESLSGPILTMEGRTLELSEVNRPTGAIMQFVFNGSER